MAARVPVFLKLTFETADVLPMGRAKSDEVDEQLTELDQNIKRLRIEYDKYFVGTMKRPPQVLQGKVNKTVAYFSNKMPRNTAQKFRFNQLNSKYQMYRQHWGRIMRQIEAGTYKSDRFKAAIHDRDRFEGEAHTPMGTVAVPAGSSPVDKLCDALTSARKKTGEQVGINRTKVAQMVKLQTANIRKQHPGSKIRFRVVIENNRAKLKASVSRS